MKKAAKMVLMVAVPVLLLGVVLSWRGPDAPSNLAAPAILASLAPAAGAAERPAASTRAAPAMLSDRLRKQFDTADNYAAFIHDAMQRPAEGGRFYAGLAYYRCMQLAALPPHGNAGLDGDAVLRDKADRSIGDLRRRCSGVQLDQHSQIGFERNMRYLNARTPDALIKGPFGMNMADDAAGIRAQLVTARIAGDPYLMALRMEQYFGRLGPLVDPIFADDAHAEVYEAALGAAICSMADSCSDNLQLQMRCYGGGECQFSDRLVELRMQLPEASRPLFDKTLKRLLKIAGKS